jgi:hypothetical protein
VCLLIICTICLFVCLLIICTVCLFVCLFVCFPAVTTHCGCIFHSPVAGFSLLVFLGFLITHNTPQSVGLLWTSDQSVAQHNTTLTTDKHLCPLVGFEPTISAGEWLKTYVLDRAAAGTSGLHLVCMFVFLPLQPIVVVFSTAR